MRLFVNDPRKLYEFWVSVNTSAPGRAFHEYYVHSFEWKIETPKFRQKFERLGFL